MVQVEKATLKIPAVERTFGAQPQVELGSDQADC